MFERFTNHAKRAVVFAQEEARAHGAAAIDVDHLAMAVLRAFDDPVAMAALAPLSCTPIELRGVIEAGLPPGTGAADGNLPFTPAVKGVVERSLAEAQALGHGHIGNEHVLLAIVAIGGTGASRELEAHGAGHAAMLTALAGAAATGFQVRTTKGLGRFRKGGKG